MDPGFCKYNTWGGERAPSSCRKWELCICSVSHNCALCGWNCKRHQFIMCWEWRVEWRVCPSPVKIHGSVKPGVSMISQRSLSVWLLCCFGFDAIDGRNCRGAKTLHDLWGKRRPWGSVVLSMDVSNMTLVTLYSFGGGLDLSVCCFKRRERPHPWPRTILQHAKTTV